MWLLVVADSMVRVKMMRRLGEASTTCGYIDGDHLEELIYLGTTYTLSQVQSTQNTIL